MIVPYNERLILFCSPILIANAAFTSIRHTGRTAKITPTVSVSVTDCHIGLDTKCSVERNGLFSVPEAKVFRGELDGVIGLVGVHIDL